MENFNVDLCENVFEQPIDIFQRLETEIQYLPAEQCQVNIYGKSYEIPRQIAAYGDSGLTYTFSGLTVACHVWTPLLLDLKKAVEKVSGTSYNFVMVNRYKDGNSCIGQHKDNEPDLDTASPISSLSFGENRLMVFKKNGSEDQKIELKDNSLLVMRPPTNTDWTHGIPRQKDRKGVRINLTFRKIVNKKRKQDLEPVSHAKKPNAMIDGAFTEGEGENVFPVGQDKFVVVSITPRNNVIVHLRQYKRHGIKLYPTKTGVTLKPEWFDRVFARTAPSTEQDLETTHFGVSSELKILSQDFCLFEFTRHDKSISITVEEWNSLSQKFEDITSLIVQYIYQSIDFKKEFQVLYPAEDACHALTFTEFSVEEIRKILVNCICDLIRDQEETATATLFGDLNVIDTSSISYFNRCMLFLTMKEIVSLFYGRLYGSATLSIPNPKCMEDFFNSVQFTQVIEESRNIFCSRKIFNDFFL